MNFDSDSLDTLGSDPGLRGYLHGLPDAAPPIALWARLQPRTAPRPARRRWPLALAAALALVVLGLALRPGERLAPAEYLQTQALEHALLAVPRSELDVAARVSLQRIDSALQSAYEREAAPQELARLWQARAAALQRLQDGLQQRPMRI